MNDLKTSRLSRKGLQDVAALAGVGIATVDRVLNERGNVSEKTAVRVLEAAKHLNLRRTLPSVRHRTIRIEVVLRGPVDEFFQRLNQAFGRMGAQLDRSIILHRSTVDERRPLTLVHHVAASTADAIILFSGTANAALLEAIGGKTARGIPVLTINSDLPESTRSVHIGPDHYRMGRTAAFFMAKMARPGSLLIVRHSEGYRGHSDRVQGFLDGLSKRRADLLVADILSGQDQTSLTHQLVYKALSKRDDVVGIYSAGGGPAGVTPALESLELAGKVIYIGHELTETSSQALRRGVQTLALDQNPEEQARQALGYLLKHFEYTTDFTLSPIPFSVISEETIENYQYPVEVPT
ncbi:LacI family transcriptional regulator [Agrobacterium rhizogenes]|uniref:LacI family DNA-binding transcriptional regulator n=1 Tax=Rhizobium rhizogenes TaxID=359 RepID=UPI00157284E2|nr:LacI family DNA-binding transcriptional regulator [Rhizobium rhizogenes]NTH16604.1 LacI family transcriptional regulator [Rhizobium rhizogenes]